jgi:hypothetical protein
MSTTSQTSDSIYSKESFSNDFTDIDDWIASLKVTIHFHIYLYQYISSLMTVEHVSTLPLIIDK